MCIAGNRGATLRFHHGIDPFPVLFAEEAGMLFEFMPKSRGAITRVMNKYGVFPDQIGTVDVSEGGNLCILSGTVRLLDLSVTVLRLLWEETSTELEKRQANKETVEAEHESHAVGRTLTYNLSFTPQTPNLAEVRGPKVAILREEGINGDREMAAAFYTAGLEPWDITMSDLLDERVTSLDDYQGLVFPGGFSYADVFGSAKGWAGPIRFNPRLREMFDRFYERSDTFSLGVCNGCQLMANIGWLPYKGVSEISQPRFLHNKSGRFESRWVGVRITSSPSILLRGMEGSVLGVNVAHGEGRLLFPDLEVAQYIKDRQLAPMQYVDPDGQPTESYPYNPNGSPEGWTALCSPDGRHLAMMPHPERSFLKWQWPWMPDDLRQLDASPWLQMFQNARTWCLEH
jgi:phosphoribosylformylglycinamidine synthase